MKVFNKTDILIPKNIDFTKWSVVACDQYTSEPEYWENVKNIVGDAPSTLKVVYPEIYLNESDKESRIKSINNTMADYLNSDIFRTLENSLILTERTQRNGLVGTGVVGVIDLEEYSFKKQSSSFVRATEGTVIERIPPRVKIRENASLEFPHILLLIDDEKKTVIEPLTAKKNNYEKIYDFELMMNSGHVTGYKIEDTDGFFNALDELFDKETFKKKYDTTSDDVLVFAVGDGNHSLATAKTCWENIKNTLSPEEQETHPARYALVEIMNIHDASLEFEPIHRVVFGVEPQKMLDELSTFYEVSEVDNGGHHIRCAYGDILKDLYIKDDTNTLAVGTIQNFIDSYLKSNNSTVDYIHGEDVTIKLASSPNNIGFLLPAMEKSELFEAIVKNGALPRKTFSMGEAHDKRFYLEAKKII